MRPLNGGTAVCPTTNYPCHSAVLFYCMFGIWTAALNIWITVDDPTSQFSAMLSVSIFLSPCLVDGEANILVRFSVISSVGFQAWTCVSVVQLIFIVIARSSIRNHRFADCAQYLPSSSSFSILLGSKNRSHCLDLEFLKSNSNSPPSSYMHFPSLAQK